MYKKLQQGLGEGVFGWAPEKYSWDSLEDCVSAKPVGIQEAPVGNQEAVTGRLELKNTCGDPDTRGQRNATTPVSTNSTPGDWTSKHCHPDPQVITTMLASRETEKSNQLLASTSLLFVNLT